MAGAVLSLLGLLSVLLLVLNDKTAGGGRPGAGATQDTPVAAPETVIADSWQRSGLRFERPVAARRCAERIEWAHDVQGRAFGPGEPKGER